MSKQVFISPDAVSQDDLLALVDDMERVTGARSSVQLALVVDTDSEAVVSALNALLTAPAKMSPAKRQPPETVTAFDLPPAPKKAVRAWRVMDGKTVVERISVEERDERLAARKFENGQIIHHPKGGYYRVDAQDGVMAQFLTAVDASGEPL